MTSQQTDPHVHSGEGMGTVVRGLADKATRPFRVRIFSSAGEARRARRPTDVILLILSVGSLAVLAFLHNAGLAEGGPLARAITALPGLFGWFWELSTDLLVVWAGGLLLVVVFGSRGRLGLLRDQVLAAGAALLAAGVTEWAVTGKWWTGLHTVWSSAPPVAFPAWRIAIAGAVIVTSSPHLSRPLRYLGRWVLGAGVIAAVAVGVATPLGAAAGFAAAVLGASAMHLAFGSPGGQPTVEEVAEALETLGVQADGLHRVGLEPRGVALVTATGVDDQGLLVRVYGRDAWDGQFLTAVWSKLWYRTDEAMFTLNRIQQVEHEAFVTLLAERSGVPVLPLVAVGMSGDGDAVVVLRDTGRPLGERPESSTVPQSQLASVWTAVERLHHAGLAHGRLDGEHLVALPDGSVAIADLSGATAPASTQDILADRAQVLVSTALLSDIDVAVAAARDALGPEGLAEVLPFVQRAALTPPTRHRLESRSYLEDLRNRTAEAAGIEVPKLQQLRRVSVGSVLTVLVVVAASYFIIAGISGLGLDTIVDQFRAAQGAWIVGAFFLAPAVAVADAFVTMGCTTRPLRLGPVIALQLAIRFVSLAVPTTAGRVAMNIRFFQKAGLPAASAVTIGALDGFSGFVVQVVILLFIALSGVMSLQDLRTGEGTGLSWLLILGVVAAIAIGIVLVLVIKRLRRWGLARLREAREPLGVLRSPSKVFELIVSNFVAQLISAIVLSMSLRAFGYSMGLAELLFINTAVSMFAGFMPVPGGIGVYEGALAGALSASGIPSAPALATALTYRLVTYYLPPIYGGFAMRWMRKHDYL
jgi:uncharacterized membrane protein YbhN (UPF0104 family)